MRGRDQRGDRGDLERRAERREDTHSSVARNRAGEGADFGDLPESVVGQSLAAGRLILPLDAALQAVEHLTRGGQRIENWEGWVKMRDGGRAKSLSHSGSFALPGDAQRAAQVARDGMQRAQARWDRDPEYQNAQLYFGLSFSRPT